MKIPEILHITIALLLLFAFACKAMADEFVIEDPDVWK